jgi:hypothetical protein
MAEVAAAGVTVVALPGILNGIWVVLKSAYDLYGQVSLRRTQLRLLLDRCNDITKAIRDTVSDGTHVSPRFQAQVAGFSACASASFLDTLRTGCSLHATGHANPSEIL